MIYMSRGQCEAAIKISKGAIHYVPALETNHEEADIKFALNIAVAASLSKA